jgi:hypothetical protein
MRGIAAVAVRSEFRRMGVAEALMTGLSRQMKRRGDALSMLYTVSHVVLPQVRLRHGRVGRSSARSSRAAPRVTVAPGTCAASSAPRTSPRSNACTNSRARSVRARSCAPTRGGGFASGAINEGVVYVDPRDEAADPGYALYDVPAEPRTPRQHALVR